MNTVIYKEVVGHKIVIGFDKCQMDPVATDEKVRDIYQETEEYAEYKELQRLCGENDNKVLSERDPSNRIMLFREADRLRQKSRDLAIRTKKKLRDIKSENLVYLQPRRNEIAIDSADMGKIKKALEGLEAGEVVTVEGQKLKLSEIGT